jgi:hypothetical protein
VEGFRAEHAEMAGDLSPNEQEMMMEAHLRQMAEADTANPYPQ